VGYALYLPPDHDAAPARRYPVVYWLHGLGGDPSRGATFVKMLDEAIRQGIAPPAIAVLVNGLRNSMYCDSADGTWPVERVLIQDLVPHVDATYRTIPSREARCIEGQSMGGFGAARLGFGYPDLFGAVSISAGALHTAETLVERRSAMLRSVFGGDRAYAEACSPWTAVERNADRIRGRTAVRLFVGDQDGLLAANERFHDLLDRLGIAHEYTVVPGAAHSYDDKVSRLGLGHFGFFARAFGAPVAG
jgi:endo-1,4-beta-xylanase